MVAVALFYDSFRAPSIGYHYMHVFVNHRIFAKLHNTTKLQNTYADPESFIRGGGSNFDVFFLLVDEEGGYKYHYKRALIGPPFKWPIMASLVAL